MLIKQQVQFAGILHSFNDGQLIVLNNENDGGVGSSLTSAVAALSPIWQSGPLAHGAACMYSELELQRCTLQGDGLGGQYMANEYIEPSEDWIMVEEPGAGLLRFRKSQAHGPL